MDKASSKRALENATKAKFSLFSLCGKSLVPFYRFARSLKIDQLANTTPEMSAFREESSGKLFASGYPRLSCGQPPLAQGIPDAVAICNFRYGMDL
jgi:hypothetical protein